MRRLLKIASALSLLLCVAAVGLWVRSYQRIYAINLGTICLNRIDTCNGRFGFARFQVIHYHNVDVWNEEERKTHRIEYETIENYAPLRDADPAAFVRWESSPCGTTKQFEEGWNSESRMSTWLPYAGHVSHTYSNVINTGGEIDAVNFYGWYITAPYWIVSLLAAMLPAVTFVRSRRRFPPMCCAACGYSLTGNTSGTCPECGTPVPSKPQMIA